MSVEGALDKQVIRSLTHEVKVLNHKLLILTADVQAFTRMNRTLVDEVETLQEELRKCYDKLGYLYVSD